MIFKPKREKKSKVLVIKSNRTRLARRLGADPDNKFWFPLYGPPIEMDENGRARNLIEW